jgi:ABC-type transport system involved in cytochrome c biogenesis permease subunit
MSEYSFVAGLLAVSLALICYVIAFASIRLARRETTMAADTGLGTQPMFTTTSMPVVTRGPSGLASYGTMIAWLGLLFISASLIFRTIAVGHGPFANMYEFSIAFAWGVLGSYLYFERRYHQRVLGLIALPVTLLLLLYATTIPATADPP